MAAFGVERGDVVMSLQFVLARETMQRVAASAAPEPPEAAAAVAAEGGVAMLERQKEPGAIARPHHGPFDELIERTATAGR